MERGLTSAEARARLQRDGPNELPEAHRTSVLLRFAREFTHFFALMLWVAAGLALIAGMPQLTIAIVAVIGFNGVFSFVQEYRADVAARRLRSLLPAIARVVRDGSAVEVAARDVVPGDLLLLSEGDRIVADGTVISADALRIDASTFTGESIPVDVQAGETVSSGTFVVGGNAQVRVTATGAATQFGSIASLAEHARRPSTPLTRELRRTVRLIAVIAVGVGLALLVVSLALGRSWSEGAIVAIGVTVALVPEALLPTVTLTLAWGAEQMARRQVLVRQLEAVETLGAVTFICTDKTGTLTVNAMTVVEAWTPRSQARCATPGYAPVAEVDITGEAADIDALAAAALRCSDGGIERDDGGWKPVGDPMEAAIVAFAGRLGNDSGRTAEAPDVSARLPFDPVRRRMSVVAEGILTVKGAPDSVLPLCGSVDRAHAEVDRLAERGLRVIAVARRVLSPGEAAADDISVDLERDLTLIGLLALSDPPRPDVAEAIDACREAGIGVAMVSGDHPLTAASIATQVGLRGPDDPVYVGHDLPADDAALGAIVDRSGIVIARVTPADKLRIAKVLRERGHVVAMTGDGVNDVPALREADVGIAMGRSGTDIARESADLVLLDDHFASIVAGIDQGRTTFGNIRRFLTYHLTDNVAELTPFLVWSLSGGNIPLALGVLQVLAIDIGTDTFSAVALGAEPAHRRMQGGRTPGRLMDRLVMRRSLGILGPTIAVMAMAAFFATYLAAGWRPGQEFPGGSVALTASGAAFATVVLGQMANAFACRSAHRWPGALGWFSNRLLWPALGIDAVLTGAMLGIPTLAIVLGQQVPTAVGWMVAVAAIPAVLGVDALDKALRRHRRGTA